VLRDWRLYLDDIREACERVARYTQAMDKTAFLSDAKTYDAVLRNPEVIGEAAKHLPEEIKVQHPEINWRKATGLRDVIAHAYFGLDHAILWDIVSRKVPELLDRLRKIPG
jgi:uncharacterized protein with HEPN domain